MAKQIVLAMCIAAAAFCGATQHAAAAAAPPQRRRASAADRQSKKLASLEKDIDAIKKTALKADGTSKIQHIVVAMLENRAFDHMLGWMGQWDVKLDGLTGTETNTIIQHDGTTVTATVNGNCPYINPFDPLHNVFNVTNELMNGNKWMDPAPMSGFAQTHYLQGFKSPETVMHGFTPDRVPAISTLAQQFAVFDKYFSSIPGPTFPNRLYFHSGTSHGMTITTNLTMLIPGAPQTSVYDVIAANNMTWRTYFEDLPDVLVMRNQRTWNDITKNVRWLEDFAADCQKGDLADYTWISPRFYADFGKQARDQHPDHDVAQGEQLIKELYEAVRNSPVWENTLLIITYDEHGGFYDHVSPPANGVPNPDGIVGGQGTINEFNYTRMGVRVPFIAVSPYIKKGQVVSYPKGAPATQFEHSSMYATLKRLYGYPQELSKRTAFAAPFDFLFEELDTPRTDCPTTIPAPPVAVNAAEASIREASQEVNDLQHELWAILASTVKDIELGVNGEQLLQHSAHKADVKAKFANILAPKVKSAGRFGGLLNAVRQQTTSASPYLHERMHKATFGSQGEMAGVVRQVMEALVPRRN